MDNMTDVFSDGGQANGTVDEGDSVDFRLAGDSRNAMKLTGNEFANVIAKAGHEFATHADYPSENRTRAVRDAVRKTLRGAI